MIYRTLLLSFIATLLIGCENEIDLAGEFEDTTVVYGLLSASEDTNFIRVQKAFLEENTNALELAENPDNIYYDNLTVKLKNQQTGKEFELESIKKKKEEGDFASAGHRVYFTTEKLKVNEPYQLQVIQADGKLTTATTTILETATIKRPSISSSQTVGLVRQVTSGLIPENYTLEINLSGQIAQAKVVCYFRYIEEFPNADVERLISVPVTTLSNEQLSFAEFEPEVNAELFYKTINNEVIRSNNKKRIPAQDNFIVEVTGVDRTYSQYTFVYGPIDGITQVKPEYSNVINGIGVLASRSKIRIRAKLGDDTVEFIRTGPYTSSIGFST
jgi:hypothetical protein